ncbi:Mrp/NBP35 family ATP-binding protein [[Limnothrix rosea] IAM M-220]|uniref:Mrp/NBP35 family ATP-binding protein n=1 Tax=[Limnothrix rosea] IAM M-220 TaxID=454133 RepID=UPI0009675CCE|nr:Mrp/NBP35 family ATP-binding protein [[Limnothrix rosea] IAM M-220]OKH19026.1 sodium:proton antiporter [[Limnothrix rosea] IAM M-220]
MIDSQAVLDALKPVKDAERKQGLVEAGKVRDIAIDGRNIAFTLALTTSTGMVKDLIVEDCKKAVMALEGVDTVEIEVVAIPKPLPSPQGIEDVQNIIAISSGKGGVGKSSVAVNVAIALAQSGAKVGLLDADIYGPNVPNMMGVGEVELKVDKSGGQDVLQPEFNHGVKFVSMAFLIDPDQPVMWRGPMINSMVRQFLYQVNWGELDYLLVDMPPGTGDAQLTMAQAVPMAGAIIVTTPQTVSLLDSRRGLKMFQQMGVNLLGIVENMSYFIPPDMPEKQYDLFGSGGGEKTAKELDVPLLGCVPLEIALREGGDNGQPIVVAQPESASAKALVSIAEAIAAKVSVVAVA